MHIEKDPFKEYLIDTAIQNIEGKITMKEAQSLIDSYYEERPVHLSDDERTEEKVDIGDAKVDIENKKVDIQDKKVDIESVLSEKGSDFSVKTTVHIHRLFEKFGFDEVFVRTVKRRIKQMPDVSYIGSGYSGHWEIK